MTSTAIAWTVGCVSSPPFELVAAATRLRAATTCSALNSIADEPLPNDAGENCLLMRPAIVPHELWDWLDKGERQVLVRRLHEPMSFDE